MSIAEENELICERLLGWKRDETYGCWRDANGLWLEQYGSYDDENPIQPALSTWAEAGLIIDALDAREPEVILRKFRVNDVNWTARIRNAEGFGNTGPLAIRACALEYIKRKEA